MSESIKRWVPIPTGVEVDVGTYGTDGLDTEEIAYLLRVGGIDARSVDQAASSAQERAAEEIERLRACVAELEDALAAKDAYLSDVAGQLARALVNSTTQARRVTPAERELVECAVRYVEAFDAADAKSTLTNTNRMYNARAALHRAGRRVLSERQEGGKP